MSPLSVKKAESITERGRHGDGFGLDLYVAPGGSKSWVQRIVVDGRRRDLGLGGFPVVSLARARTMAAANRTAVAEGRDPLADKRRASMPTFREAAETVYQANLHRWRNGKHTKTWWQTLELYALPRLGRLPLDRIEPSDVLAVLEPIWGTRKETAKRVRQRIRSVLAWGMSHDFVGRNVAGEVLDGALPKSPKVKVHYRSLSYKEVPSALTVVDKSGASLSARLCLRFLVLTAARSGEARGATWDEIELEERQWRVPAHRMKSGFEHRVPLSRAALEVLEVARMLKDESNLVFPSPVFPGRPMSDMTLTKVLRSTGLAARATVHGFRGSFKNWSLEQTNEPWAVSETALAHALGDADEQAYATTDLFDRRRRPMEVWGDFVAPEKYELKLMES